MNWYLSSICVLLIVSVGDYLTTVVGVSTGAMSEANPTAAAFMDVFGVYAGFALLSVIGIVLIMSLACAVRKVGWRGSALSSNIPIAVFAGLKLFATYWNASLILS